MDLCCYRHGILSLVFENISYIRKLADGGIELEEDGIKYTYHKKGGIYKEDNDLAPWFDLYRTDSSRQTVQDDPEPEEDEPIVTNNRHHSYRDYDSRSYGYGGCGSGGCGGYTYHGGCGFGGCGGYSHHYYGGCGFSGC